MKHLLSLILLFSLLPATFAQDMASLRAKADSLYDAQVYHKATKAYDAFIAHDSSQAETFHRRGTCFLKDGLYVVAEKDFRRAIHLDSSYASPHYNLAEILLRREDLQGGLAHFRRFSQLEPTDPDGYMRMGILYAQLNQPDSLFRCIEQSYALDSSDWRVLQNAAGGYYAFDEYEKAAQMAARGLALYPEKTEFYSLAGDIYKALGQYDKAVACFDQAIEQFPNDSRWHNEKSSFQLLANTRQEVLVDGSLSSKRFLDIYSENTPQLDKWSQDEAHPYYFETLKKHFDNAPETLGLDEFFMLYYGSKLHDFKGGEKAGEQFKDELAGDDYAKDLETIRDFAASNPFDPELYYYEAVCHYELKDYEGFGKALGKYYGFMLGMMYTGDGELFESAYIVANVRDEYLIMDLLGLHVTEQSLSSHNGHHYDILKGSSAEEEMPREVHFNIDKHFESLGDLFGGDLGKGKKKKKKRKKK